MSLESGKGLRDWDAERDKLRSRWPGWRIWFVPQLAPGGGLHVAWCAQPEPLLNCGSPEELEEQMQAAAQHLAQAMDDQA